MLSPGDSVNIELNRGYSVLLEHCLDVQMGNPHTLELDADR